MKQLNLSHKIKMHVYFAIKLINLYLYYNYQKIKIISGIAN